MRNRWRFRSLGDDAAAAGGSSEPRNERAPRIKSCFPLTGLPVVDGVTYTGHDYQLQLDIAARGEFLTVLEMPPLYEPARFAQSYTAPDHTRHGGRRESAMRATGGGATKKLLLCPTQHNRPADAQGGRRKGTMQGRKGHG